MVYVLRGHREGTRGEGAQYLSCFEGGEVAMCREGSCSLLFLSIGLLSNLEKGILFRRSCRGAEVVRAGWGIEHSSALAMKGSTLFVAAAAGPPLCCVSCPLQHTPPFRCSASVILSFFKWKPQ